MDRWERKFVGEGRQRRREREVFKIKKFWLVSALNRDQRQKGKMILRCRIEELNVLSPISLPQDKTINSAIKFEFLSLPFRVLRNLKSVIHNLIFLTLFNVSFEPSWTTSRALDAPHAFLSLCPRSFPCVYVLESCSSSELYFRRYLLHEASVTSRLE